MANSAFHPSRGRLMSSNPCYSGLRRQTAEDMVRGVVYRPRQRVLLAARLECRLTDGSRPRNGDERRSLALWAVREPTGHWGLCLCLLYMDANTQSMSGTCLTAPTAGNANDGNRSRLAKVVAKSFRSTVYNNDLKSFRIRIHIE